MDNDNLFVIRLEDANKIFNYLLGQPYGAVAPLVAILQGLKPLLSGPKEGLTGATD